MTLWLAEHIVKNKFTGAIVFGSLREGKTSYAMKVAFRIHKLEYPEWTDKQCWDEVFKNMFFNLEDMIKYLEAKLISKDDKLLPCIILDDAGVSLGSSLFFENRDTSFLIKKLTDTIGTITKGFILTTPNPEELLKTIRSGQYYKIKITRENTNERRARIYKTVLLPSGTINIRSLHDDFYNVLLPDDVYEKYNPIRKSYATQAILNLHKHMDEKKAEKLYKENKRKARREEMESEEFNEE